MGIGDWGLGIGDWGLGPIPNPQTPIPNPQYIKEIKNNFYYFNYINIIYNKKKISLFIVIHFQEPLTIFNS